VPIQVDVHQHVWTQPLVEALASRRSLPFIARTDGLTLLHCAGERPYVIDIAAEAPVRRAQLLATDRLDRAIVAVSSPIGIEGLDRESADLLIDAHLEGVAALGERFAAWGPLALQESSPDDVDELLDRGCVGISMPAAALAGIDALEAVAPVLQRIAVRGVPLFVHPGPAAGNDLWEASLTEPLWWPALTDYMAQMQAAWLAVATLGRKEHPDLVVLFAMLAGVAPLLAERLATRGGPPVDLRDPWVFYDTSSYGAGAIETMARLVGADQLVYGSDRPVIEPIPTDRDTALRVNAGRLLAPARSAV